MESKHAMEKKISRKHFLRICGSVLAGGSILGVTGNLLWKMFTRPEALFYDVERTHVAEGRAAGKPFVSPYRKVSAFQTPGEIEAFDLYQGRLYVATPNNIDIYEPTGDLVDNFSVGSSVRDLTVAADRIYLLFPARIEVYSLQGELLTDWEACDEEADYCSLAVVEDKVFVTDAAHKNIHLYTDGGGFLKFIESPSGFIVPSYSFGITQLDGVIYCSNPGRHLVESYTPEGEFIASFGKGGGAEGHFSGCCNPVYLTSTSTGELLTSEKGIPRISCYDKQGGFRSVLLDEKALGGGHNAYEVRVWEDKLVVAGKTALSLFQYKKEKAGETACATCGIPCPLKEGLTI